MNLPAFMAPLGSLQSLQGRSMAAILTSPGRVAVGSVRLPPGPQPAGLASPGGFPVPAKSPPPQTPQFSKPPPTAYGTPPRALGLGPKPYPASPGQLSPVTGSAQVSLATHFCQQTASECSMTIRPEPQR